MGKRKSYAEEEMNLSDQSKAFVDYLTSRGVLSDQKISDKNIREKKKELAKKAYHNTLLLLILDSVEKALETVLEDFRGIEAMYEVEVKITGETNSDSRKLRCILPYQTGGKDYVNCLFVQKEYEALSSRPKQQDKGFGGSGETNTVTEKLTVHLHGMESVYTVSAKFPEKNIYETGEIISNQKQENGISSIFDCICTGEKETASIDEKAAAELL